MQQFGISQSTDFANFKIHGLERFTAQIRSSIIRKLKLRFLDVPKQANDNDAFEDIRPRIRIPYLGRKGEYLVKKLVKKLQRNLTEPVKFVVLYQTKKISYFLPKKDKFLIFRGVI